MSEFSREGRFNIHPPTVEFEGRQIEWHKQKNGNDCGPCLLLNALEVMKISHSERTIHDVRTAVNTSRREGNRQELADNGWLSTNDIEAFMQKYNFKVTTYSIIPQEKDRIFNLIQQQFQARDFDLIYTTQGSHFRGLRPKNDSSDFVMLDSFLDAPTILSDQQAWAQLQKTMAAPQRPNGAYESIGFLEKKFKIHKKTFDIDRA